MDEELLEPDLIEAYERHAQGCPKLHPVDVPREMLLHLLDVYRRYIEIGREAKDRVRAG